MTTPTLPPLPEPTVIDVIRAVGGIVHRDGNIFFTNEAQFLAARQAIAQAPIQAVQEAVASIDVVTATRQIRDAYAAAIDKDAQIDRLEETVRNLRKACGGAIAQPATPERTMREAARDWYSALSHGDPHPIDAFVAGMQAASAGAPK